MFDFLFGGKNKLNLIRELLEMRMKEAGFDDFEYRLKTKNLSNLQLVGTPEGTVVSIIEVVLKLQKSGKLLTEILQALEGHRARIGSDPETFRGILHLARSNSVEQASTAVARYCIYRAQLEHSNIIREKQIIRAMFLATNALSGFTVYSPEMMREIELLYDEM